MPQDPGADWELLCDTKAVLFQKSGELGIIQVHALSVPRKHREEGIGVSVVIDEEATPISDAMSKGVQGAFSQIVLGVAKETECCYPVKNTEINIRHGQI